MKPPLLYLCHRIPYPPNKGDKIRSYHLLKYLCENYEVYLGAFIDDPIDWEYVSVMEKLCVACHFLALDTSKAKIRSLAGFLEGLPLTLPYYRNDSMSHWVKQVVDNYQIERVIVYSSAMAQYVTEQLPTNTRKIIDFVDIDSDKWRQYAVKKTWPMKWIYQREAKKLFDYELSVLSDFDASLFVSSAEADLFRSMTPNYHQKISHYNNGVDTEYYSPSSKLTNPYPGGQDVLVFTGAMDYWPNIDAVSWFAENVLPEINKVLPKVHFYIVGSNPTDKVKNLAKLNNVLVTGRVNDIRAYIYHARAAIAPMRIARGVQNKVLEAMSMEKTVIVSDQGLEGISAVPGREVLVASTAMDIVDTVLRLIAGDYETIGMQARKRVIEDFNWGINLKVIKQCLEC